MNDFPFNNLHCKGDEIAKPTVYHSQVITTTRKELNYLCSAVPSWQEKVFRGQGMYYNVTITSCMSCSTDMQATADIVQDVLLGGTISSDSTDQKDKAFFTKKKNTPVQLPWPFGNLKNDRLAIKNPDMIYLLTNVAKTQDVPLDGTIFFGNTGQKARVTFMNKNIPIQLS